MSACTPPKEDPPATPSGEPPATAHGPSHGPAPSADPAPGGDLSIAESCNVEGDDNEVECVINPAHQPPAFAEAFIGPDTTNYVLPGPPSDLPEPPPSDYSPPTVGCQAWRKWLQEDSGFYRTKLGLFVRMQVGSHDSLMISDIDVDVLDRKKAPEELTKVKCVFGAGANYGHYVVHDTRTPQTYLLDGEERTPMPPASISLDQGSSATAGMRVVSKSGYLYEGLVRIRMLVNGEEKEISFGSEEKPARWLGGEYDKTPETSYAWDTDAGKWTQGLDLFP